MGHGALVEIVMVLPGGGLVASAGGSTFRSGKWLVDQGLYTQGSAGDCFPEAGIDISEVEPAANIVKRFATGAMFFGSISF